MDESISSTFHAAWTEMRWKASAAGSDGCYRLTRSRSADCVVALFIGKRELHCAIQQAAVMPVTRHWISVDSCYEACVADALLAADRHFVKPLRYDAAGQEIFPDFLLLDLPASSAS